MLPVILVTTDRRDGGPAPHGPRVRPVRPEAWVGESYVQAVRAAGGLPLLLPPGPADVDTLLRVASGVVLTGGHFDIDPALYGQSVVARLDRVEPTRTALELALARECLDRGVPILGVCGGHQLLAVAAGGSLVQDVPAQIAGALVHEQPTDPATPWHTVRVHDPARAWLGDAVQVNSTHHQAVQDPGRGFVACGWSEDGVIEVIAHTTHPFALGVQWHPELLDQLDAYRCLIEACAR